MCCHVGVKVCRQVEVKVCRHVGVSVNWTSDKRTLILAEGATREATSLMISYFVAVLYDLWRRGEARSNNKSPKKISKSI